METAKERTTRTDALAAGTWAALATYAMWGVFPIYWKQVAQIDALGILCHRVLWSAVFLLAVLWLSGKTRLLAPIVRRHFWSVAACAVLITANWGTYIWAVNSGRVTESSLGYYVTPLLSILLGRVFFGEKMDRWTISAVALAAAGVAAAAAMAGEPPLVAVTLAVTFSVYGALKKKAGLDALAGLCLETVLVAPFALAWLLWTHSPNWVAFFGPDARSTVFLVMAGPVTAVPLLTFAYAAVRIPLQRIGCVQYLSPTIQLTIGLTLYGELVGAPMMLAFGTVVCAVAVYLVTRKKMHRDLTVANEARPAGPPPVRK
jgi:chloramphenicol-sensitive protein RarD